MGFLLPIISLFLPRTVSIFIWILTDWFDKAYETALWPFLGFIFLPLTTLTYMAAMFKNDHEVTGIWVLLIILAWIIDMGWVVTLSRKFNS